MRCASIRDGDGRSYERPPGRLAGRPKLGGREPPHRTTSATPRTCTPAAGQSRRSIDIDCSASGRWDVCLGPFALPCAHRTMCKPTCVSSFGQLPKRREPQHRYCVTAILTQMTPEHIALTRAKKPMDASSRSKSSQAPLNGPHAQTGFTTAPCSTYPAARADY
jgi:hypothetical protein